MGHEHGLEGLLRHARLLCAEILDVQAQDAGKFGKVIDVAAGGDELQHLTVADGLALLRIQAVARAIGVLVLLERLAVRGVVELIAHLVQGVALAGLVAV